VYFCNKFEFFVTKMINNKLTGMGVALITPFKTDESIDFEALSRLVEYQIKNGTDYLVVCGTTAETATLTNNEIEEVTRFIIDCNAGRLPIVLGIGGNNTRAVVDNIRNTNLQGVDAILSVTPYYNKPSQEGLYQHYAAIAQSTALPILLYNVPGRTGVNMLAATTIRLAKDFKNIVGIKEASGSFSQIDDIIKNTSQPTLWSSRATMA
jgi:4-hydroxy-tetrahydrodipicolinate synthase